MVSSKKILIKNYTQELSKHIPKNYPHKAKILKRIKQDLQIHMQETPSASWAAILEDFGSPAEIIELFISEYSGMEIKNNLQKKKIQERILVTLCILCFFCSLGSLGYMYYQENYQPSFKNEPQYILENGATIPLKNIQND